MKILILLILTCCCSCNLFDNPSVKDKEPVYNADVAWEYKLEHSPTLYSLVSDGYYYLPMISEKSGEASHCTIAKIDGKTGEELWISREFEGNDISSPPRKCGDIIVCMTTRYRGWICNDIVLINDNTGEIITEIRFSDDLETAEIFRSWGCSFVITEKGLYWGGAKTKGILHLSFERIDMDLRNQVIQPEIVYSFNDGRSFKDAAVDENCIYFVTYEGSTNKDFSGIQSVCAWSWRTGELVWRQEIDQISHGTLYPVLIDGDILYVVDSSVAAFDKNTGEILWLQDMSRIDPKKTFYLSTSPLFNGPLELYDNKLYYTNHMHSSTPSSSEIPYSLIDNMVCISAVTGELVWRARTPDGGSSLFTNCIARNGRAYFATDQGLRVFDADTGKLIGVDYSINSDGFGSNLESDGIMAIVTFKDNKSYLTGIRI